MILVLTTIIIMPSLTYTAIVELHENKDGAEEVKLVAKNGFRGYNLSN